MKRPVSRRVASLAALATLVLGCDPRGYMVWATNESDVPVLVLLGGYSSLGEVSDPAARTYRVEPHGSVAKAPFVDLRRTADGLIDAEVRVLALDCTVLAAFTVNANDYALRIDESGSVILDSYWIGQRPTTQDTLEATTQCVEP